MRSRGPFLENRSVERGRKQVLALEENEVATRQTFSQFNEELLPTTAGPARHLFSEFDDSEMIIKIQSNERSGQNRSALHPLWERSDKKVAEGEGFEPPVGLPLRLISSQVPSTAQPPFRCQGANRYRTRGGAANPNGRG